MLFKINKCIFIGVRMKAFTMQSKNKIDAWAHMRPPFGNDSIVWDTNKEAYLLKFNDKSQRKHAEQKYRVVIF